MELRDNQLKYYKVPKGVIASSLLVADDQSLLLVDNAMRIYIRPEKSRKWLYSDAVKFEEPAEYRETLPDPVNRFYMVNGKKGYYIFSRGMSEDRTRMAYVTYNSTRFKRVNLPKGYENLYNMVEIDDGVLLSPTFTLMARPVLYYKPIGASTWQERRAPASDCNYFSKTSEGNIKVRCKGVFYESNDLAQSWEKTI